VADVNAGSKQEREDTCKQAGRQARRKMMKNS